MHEHVRSADTKSARRLSGYLTGAISLSRAQSIAGFVAATLSIAGTVFGYLNATYIPQTGDMLMVVRDRQTAQPVTDAIVEVLTPDNALVTTFPTLERNGARRSLREGAYRVRVTNPRFATETRTIQVLAGQTAEIRFLLSPRVPVAAIPPAPAVATVPPAPTTPAAVMSPVATKPAAVTNPAVATKSAVATKPIAAIKSLAKRATATRRARGAQPSAVSPAPSGAVTRGQSHDAP